MIYLSNSLTQILLLVFVVMGAFFGTSYYRRFAIQRHIIAKITFRSLHERTVSRGAGIVFASAFSLMLFAVWVFSGFPTWLMFSFGLGGGMAAIVGFIDDVAEVQSIKKLFAQFCLAVWIFINFYKPLHAPYFSHLSGSVLPVLLSFVLLFVSVWFINLYNFMDGIDGMAISGAIFICVAAMIVLTLTGGDKDFIFIFALLAASSVGFLFFNLPPASVFMGDAGSIFLGYCLGGLLIATILSGQISVWTWVTILGYFLGDTTITGGYRILFVKRWYGEHRSHAYQNLARIFNNHAKVTYGVVFYNILWALPLAIFSVLVPSMAPVASLLSLVPAVLWTLKFGPRLSSN